MLLENHIWLQSYFNFFLFYFLGRYKNTFLLYTIYDIKILVILYKNKAFFPQCSAVLDTGWQHDQSDHTLLQTLGTNCFSLNVLSNHVWFTKVRLGVVGDTALINCGPHGNRDQFLPIKNLWGLYKKPLYRRRTSIFIPQTCNL